MLKKLHVSLGLCNNILESIISSNKNFIVINTKLVLILLCFLFNYQNVNIHKANCEAQKHALIGKRKIPYSPLFFS